MTDAIDLTELQNLTIPEIVERLPTLDAAQLKSLRAMEAKADAPRSGVMDAIDKASAAAKAPKADAKPTAKAPKMGAEPKAEPAPWREQDYTGPLTADQAEWRNAHFKPVQVARTK